MIKGKNTIIHAITSNPEEHNTCSKAVIIIPIIIFSNAGLYLLSYRSTVRNMNKNTTKIMDGVHNCSNNIYSVIIFKKISFNNLMVNSTWTIEDWIDSINKSDQQMETIDKNAVNEEGNNERIEVLIRYDMYQTKEDVIEALNKHGSAVNCMRTFRNDCVEVSKNTNYTREQILHSLKKNKTSVKCIEEYEKNQRNMMTSLLEPQWIVYSPEVPEKTSVEKWRNEMNEKDDDKKKMSYLAEIDTKANLSEDCTNYRIRVLMNHASYTREEAIDALNVNETIVYCMRLYREKIVELSKQTIYSYKQIVDSLCRNKTPEKCMEEYKTSIETLMTEARYTHEEAEQSLIQHSTLENCLEDYQQSIKIIMRQTTYSREETIESLAKHKTIIKCIESYLGTDQPKINKLSTNQAIFKSIRDWMT